VARNTLATPAHVVRWLAAASLCAVLLVAAPRPAAAATPTGIPELQADLAHQIALAGPHDGGYVYDLTTHTALFSQRASTLRPPASVEKLYTATTALQLLGATARLSTSVLGAGQMNPLGVLEGDLYLRGGGDPTFGSTSFITSHYGGTGASVTQLANALVNADGLREVTGRVLGDESYWDSRRGEPSSNYAFDPFLEGNLSALEFDRGIQGHEHGAHAPAAYAARKLLAALKADGVHVRGGSGAGTTPAGAATLATAESPTVAELLALMLPPSDNFFAESLLKDLGARFGGAGTTAAGAAVVTATIGTLLGFRPRVVDGSGLSPADHTSPYQVVSLLAGLYGTPIGDVLRGSMAVAGRTGTLALRMRHTRAAGRCQGKTGTLTGASNLAGYCAAADGHTLAFAFFNDGISTTAAHVFQDHMTISLAGY
jgi:D-alanyl-D-alanine carboxypeptidase/D-alanyl-D-alanine-endopeptidase (penicillin-binding protein 4)